MRDTFNPTMSSKRRADDLLREAREEVADLRRRIYRAIDMLRASRSMADVITVLESPCDDRR